MCVYLPIHTTRFGVLPLTIHVLIVYSGSMLGSPRRSVIGSPLRSRADIEYNQTLLDTLDWRIAIGGCIGFLNI